MEILVGTNAPVRHRVLWKGETIDADDLPLVTLYTVDKNDNIADEFYSSYAEKSETDVGVYNMYPDMYVTEMPRELKAVWTYMVDGSPITKSHDLYIVNPYVDLSEAIDVLGFGSDPSDPNHKTYQELLEAEKYARKSIEAYTQQKFFLYEDTIATYGAGTDILPFDAKINTVYQLNANDLLLFDLMTNTNTWGVPIQITESGFGIRVNRADMLDNTVFTANGMVPPTINDVGNGLFKKNVRYTINGIFGWDEIPDDISLATIELMRDYFSKDKVWRNKYIKSISTFDWQFDFNTTTFSGTGNNYVDQLLLPYIPNKMVLI